MSLKIKKNDYEFSLPPKGKHIARCFGVIDLGIQKNKNYGNSSPKILIAWELSNELMQNGKPFTLMQCYTASLNKKSKLKALLESWRGKKFDLEELNGFQLGNMLNEPCCLTIDHVVNEEGQKYIARVFDISPLPIDSDHYPDLQNELISFDLDYYTEENYLAVPENIRKKINLMNT